MISTPFISSQIYRPSLSVGIGCSCGLKIRRYGWSRSHAHCPLRSPVSSWYLPGRCRTSSRLRALRRSPRRLLNSFARICPISFSHFLRSFASFFRLLSSKVISTAKLYIFWLTANVSQMYLSGKGTAKRSY